MYLKYPIGNITSSKMLKLEEQMERMGFVCHVDKFGKFWCKFPGIDKLKIQYSDNYNSFMIQYDDMYAILTGIDDVIIGSINEKGVDKNG